MKEKNSKKPYVNYFLSIKNTHFIKLPYETTEIFKNKFLNQ